MRAALRELTFNVLSSLMSCKNNIRCQNKDICVVHSSVTHPAQADRSSGGCLSPPHYTPEMLRGIQLLFPFWTEILNITKSQTSFSALVAWMYDYELHVLESIAKKDVLLSSAGEHVFQQGLSFNEFIPLLQLIPRCVPLPLSSSKPKGRDLATLATVFDISPSLHQSPNRALIRPRSAVTCVTFITLV